MTGKSVSDLLQVMFSYSSFPYSLFWIGNEVEKKLCGSNCGSWYVWYLMSRHVYNIRCDGERAKEEGIAGNVCLGKKVSEQNNMIE